MGLDNLNDYYDPTLKDYRLSEIEKATNDGNRTNLASSKIQTSRSWNYWFEREFELSCAPFCAQALRGGLASQVEELPVVMWPLVGF